MLSRILKLRFCLCVGPKVTGVENELFFYTLVVTEFLNIERHNWIVVLETPPPALLPKKDCALLYQTGVCPVL